MAKRFTDTEKWKKGFIRNLPAKFKLLWLYILDDCNHAGIWDTDFEVASIRIGSKISEKEACRVFAEQIKIFDKGNKWFIPKFIDFQYGTLNENSRPHQAVIKLLDKYDVYNIEGISPVDVAGFDNEIKKPVIKRFIEPSIDEVEAYCIERNNRVDSMKFHSYYTSNGWRVGKDKMKDWKGAVRYWEANTPKDNTGRKQLDNKDYNKF
ncbi:MAG: hypothetical protein Unbinned8210contig1002_37 [Prokaryotic dsDNA virus sp.]|nr:MAG: hypothetical protein Unbinned8210contig1002_37 [Prokaryotic dsDNA virus sp.]|tara:strand:- start:1983 stop:2606 length:624 start_codon:yes stop_codon:yes gene_type:complete